MPTTKPQETNSNRKKGFFARMIEKLDKKLEEKSHQSSCCPGENDDPNNPSQRKGSSCC